MVSTRIYHVLTVILGMIFMVLIGSASAWADTTGNTNSDISGASSATEESLDDENSEFANEITDEGEEEVEIEVPGLPQTNEWYEATDCSLCHEDQAAAMIIEEEEETEAEEEETQETSDETNEDSDASKEASTVTETSERSEGIATIHARFLECSSCHNIDELAEIHDGVSATDKMPTSLKKTSIDVEAVCYQCHNLELLAEATEESEALTDTEGTVVNPHDLPENDEHAESITCVNCHKSHSGGVTSKIASRVCNSCHHAGVYECYTCHDA